LKSAASTTRSRHSRRRPSKADELAAERWFKFANLWHIHPALHGRYPEGVLPADRQAELLGWQDGDDKLVRAELDFAGLNYYSTWLVADDPNETDIPGLHAKPSWATYYPPHHKTDNGWDIYARGFYDILLKMNSHLGGKLPIEITENGAAYNTGIAKDGRVHDANRIAWLRPSARTVARRPRWRAGARLPLLALLDNFEWSEGYNARASASSTSISSMARNARPRTRRPGRARREIQSRCLKYTSGILQPYRSASVASRADNAMIRPPLEPGTWNPTTNHAARRSSP
jgi:beta-glucosidase/6-phospho-beta-glucosidase/beta-galactosidase